MALIRSTRRDFLRAVGAGASLAAAPAPFSANQIKGSRPNILWLTSEDNNTTLVSCYGNSFATTPNLDRLASQGLLYRNAFCTAPVCAPARLHFIVGDFPASVW